MAKFEIMNASERRFPSVPYWWRLEYFSGATGLVVVAALMVISDRIHFAEIVVLCCFLVLEGCCRWIFLVIVLLIALSPVICIFFCFWICCCKPKEGKDVLDLAQKGATTEHIVRCDGECAICLQSIDPGNQIYQLPCSDKHIFHVGCLNKWSQVKLTCPACRTEMPFKRVDLNSVQASG